MSRDDARELIERAEEDEALWRELEQALSEKEGGAGSFLAVAARHGFEFTGEEFLHELEARREGARLEVDDLPGAGELSDSDLERVAGGVGFSAFGSRWGSLGNLQGTFGSEPVKFPVCPDGIVK